MSEPESFQKVERFDLYYIFQRNVEENDDIAKAALF